MEEQNGDESCSPLEQYQMLPNKSIAKGGITGKIRVILFEIKLGLLQTEIQN